MSRRTGAYRYNITPEQLFTAAHHEVVRSLDLDHPNTTPIKIGLRYGFEICPIESFRKLGQSFRLGTGRQALDVRIPSLPHMWRSRPASILRSEADGDRFIDSLRTPEEISQDRQAAEELTTRQMAAIVELTPADLACFRARNSLNYRRQTNWDQLFHRFAVRSVEQQRQDLSKIYAAAAGSLLYVLLCAEEPPEQRARVASMGRGGSDNDDIANEGFKLKLNVWLGFLRRYYWALGAMPVRVIERFLPAGAWMPNEGGGSGNVEGGLIVCGPGPRVPRDDYRIDPTRFDFYHTVGCRGVVEPAGALGAKNYVAFLLQARSGLRVAILDCKVVGNAAYAFRIGYDEDEAAMAWARDAEKTKGEVRSGHAPTFLCCFYHCVNWQDQVRAFLDTAQ